MQSILAAHEKRNESLHRFYHPTFQKDMVKLQPGDVYVTDKPELITTGLGSCIAACIWDPKLRIGGMNHFMLPFHGHHEAIKWHADEFVSFPARYGNYAMEILINALVRMGSNRPDLRIKVFGGAKVMDSIIAIGEKNIEFVMDYIAREQMDLVSFDLGSTCARKVLFDL